MALNQAILIGRICDLSGFDSGGWRRRELNVKRGSDGYPQVRDTINLLDSDGIRYPNLPFVMGARHGGHSCLGQPGALKQWFRKHYDEKTVHPETVYVEPTGRSNEYRIHTETEWAAKAARRPA
jgi:hypothetical protein